MKVGLYIITQLHDITQAGFEVKFSRHFKGMIRIDFLKKLDESFYEREHCGFPGASRAKLEKDIIQSLIRFKTKHMIPDVTEHDDENS